MQNPLKFKAHDISKAVANLASALESNQNKWNRAMYDSQPEVTRKQMLQNSYNNGMNVKRISEMTGVPVSTIYTKIDTKEGGKQILKT